MIHVLSAGACKGLFQTLYPKQLKSGAVQASFGAVGAMQETLLAGAPCELLVSTVPLLKSLAEQGWIDESTIQFIGQVCASIAIADRKPLGSDPDVSTREHLRANLLAATAIHYPDPLRSTAGIHFDKVLNELGVDATVKSRCHHYANGAFAMQALAKHAPALGALQIGCTQASEILYTDGVRIVGPLPAPFELNTGYAAALTISGLDSSAARKMLDYLTGPNSHSLRIRSGFTI